MNARTVYSLVRPTARAIRWGPAAIAGGLALAALIVIETLATGLTTAQLTDLLRIAAACGALGIAFMLDDPATTSLLTVPASRLIRHLLRAAITLPAAALWWIAILAITTVEAKSAVAAALPRGALTVEATALTAVALALAAVGQRYSTGGNTGVIAAPALLITVAIMWFLPHQVALALAPADPHWTAAHHRWVALLAAAVIGFLLASREPTPHRDRARRGGPLPDMTPRPGPN
jgi:hypothetical protein